MFNNAFRKISAQLAVSTCTLADTATFWIHQTLTVSFNARLVYDTALSYFNLVSAPYKEYNCV